MRCWAVYIKRNHLGGNLFASTVQFRLRGTEVRGRRQIRRNKWLGEREVILYVRVCICEEGRSGGERVYTPGQRKRKTKKELSLSVYRVRLYGASPPVLFFYFILAWAFFVKIFFIFMFFGFFFCSRPLSVVFATDQSTLTLCKGLSCWTYALMKYLPLILAFPMFDSSFFHVQ